MSPTAAIAAAITWIAGVFSFTGAARFGWAFIVVGILAKVITLPLTIKQTKSTIKMTRLKPELDKLKKRWGHDRERFGREQTELFSRNEISPLGCIGPFAVQMVLLSMVYFAMRAVVQAHGEGNLPFYFFGDLADPTASGFGGWLLLAIMGLAGVLSALQTAGSDPKQRRIAFVMPLVFGFVFLNFPIGVILYYTVSTIFQYGQQYVMLRHTALGEELLASRAQASSSGSAGASNGRANGRPNDRLGDGRANGRGSQSKGSGERGFTAKATPIASLPSSPTAGRRNRNRKKGRV